MEKSTDQRLEELEAIVNSHSNEIKALKESRAQPVEKAYTVKEVAEILKVSAPTVNFHIRNGRIRTLPGKKRYKRIAEGELKRFISQKPNQSPNDQKGN